jgi:hypothetical protein
MYNLGDRHGYYKIGNFKTYCISEIMDMSKIMPKTKRKHTWIYNDDFFSQYDWKQEPTESLDELYKNRAEQLRRDYDYLILYYSGGYDSTNVLYAFLDNNIPIDEIVIYYNRYDTVSHQYFELKDYTWEKVERIKKQYPKIKIRKIDYTDYFFKWDSIIDECNTGKRYIDHFGVHLSINRIITDVLHKYIDDWKQLLADKKKVAWITGYEKPCISYSASNNNWIFYFNDGSVQFDMSPTRQLIDDGTIGVREQFYWAPADLCAKIIIKQCHLITKVAEEYTKGGSVDVNIIPYTDIIPIDNIIINNSDTLILKILYPKLFNTDESFYNQPKVVNPIWGNRDQWYYNSDYPNSKKHWKIATDTFDKQHWKTFFNGNGIITDGFKKSTSKDYVFK